MADGGWSRGRVIGKRGDTHQPQLIRSHTGTEAQACPASGPASHHATHSAGHSCISDGFILYHSLS